MSRKQVIAIGALGTALWAGGCTAPNPAYHLARSGQEDPSAQGAGGSRQVPTPDAGAPRTPDGAPVAQVPDAVGMGDAVAPADAARSDVALPSDLNLNPPPPDAGAQGDVAFASTPGLVAHWRLDRGTGTIVVDETGANSGTLTGVTLWNDEGFSSTRFVNRGSLQLDGAGIARLGVATLPGLDRPKTISLWFWIGATSTAQRETILVLSNRAMSRSIQIGLEKGKIAMWSFNQAVDYAHIYEAVPPGAGWHHVAYIWDGTKHYLYVRGALAGSSYWAPPAAPVAEALLGAFDANNPAERFHGRIDDVRIYDRAYDAAMIADLAAGRP